MNNISRISASSALPVSVDLAKKHARIWTTDDDDYLAHLINAAVATVEGPNGIGMALLTSEWRQHHGTPQTGPLSLPLAPVQSVTKVEVMNAGIWADVDSDAYRATTDIRPALAEPVTSWPAHEQIRVTFKSGFGNTADTIPADLQAAIYMLITHWYENRAPLDGSGNEMPFAVTSILDRWR